MLRAWGPPERPWVLAVEPEGARWRIEAWGPDPPTARAAVRALFSLHHPLEEFYRQVRREPILAGTERRFRGLRVTRDASVYESLVHAIIGQQLSVSAARAIQRRLLDRTGPPLMADGIEVPFVPGPRALRAVGEAGLRAVGLSRTKSRALVALTSRDARRRWSSSRLGEDPVPTAVGELVGLFGVGRWTAENALLRGTGRRDVFVAGDLGIRAALATYGGPPRAAPEMKAREWADRWYPGWGSYATLYLWRRLVVDRHATAG